MNAGFFMLWYLFGISGAILILAIFHVILWRRIEAVDATLRGHADGQIDLQDNLSRISEGLSALRMNLGTLKCQIPDLRHCAVCGCLDQRKVFGDGEPMPDPNEPGCVMLGFVHKHCRPGTAHDRRKSKRKAKK